MCHVLNYLMEPSGGDDGRGWDKGDISWNIIFIDLTSVGDTI